MVKSKLKLIFVSSNTHKISEVQRIVASADIEIVAIATRIAERQFSDIKEVVRKKALEAFSQFLRPLFVEHTALYLPSLNGFPGGQTQHFWDCLGPGRFSELFGGEEVSAKSVLGYCDGRRLHVFEGDVKGVIAKVPSGKTEFQWDCVFVPMEPHDFGKPFADLGMEKDEISMRRKALNKLCRHLGRPID